MKKIIAGILISFVLVVPPNTANAADKAVTIGYQSIIHPVMAAIFDRAFEKSTGYTIKWKKFESGFKAIEDFAKGNIQLALVGSSPIAVGASYGLDMELFWIVEDTNNAQALVVRRGSKITTPQDLRGKKIGVPFGSTAHFHVLFALEQFNIKKTNVKLINLQPAAISGAWELGTIDAAFIWSPTLVGLLRSGRVLISSGQLNRWGRATFDGMVANKTWAAKNPKFMVQFVKTFAAADASYRNVRYAWKLQSENIKKISKLLNVLPETVLKTLNLSSFLSPRQQLSRRWLGGHKKSGAAQALYYTSEFLKNQNVIKKTLPEYSGSINDQWVREAFGHLR